MTTPPASYDFRLEDILLLGVLLAVFVVGWILTDWLCRDDWAHGRRLMDRYVSKVSAPLADNDLPSEDVDYVNSVRYRADTTVPIAVSAPGIKLFDVNHVPSDLTYREKIIILARQIGSDGKPLYSGKKIYNLVGGNYNEFCAIMRRLRAKDSEPAEEPDIFTPIAGRPTKASYFTDPDLVYEPPD